MKRNTLVIAALFVVGTVMSQDLTSKKGELYTPEAGEYSIGIDATPFLNYFGNFIGGNGLNTAPVFQPNGEATAAGQVMHSIYGKMMIDANSAYRANVRIGFNNQTDRTLVPDADTAGEEVENKTKDSDFGIVLGAGKEWRRGNTRLQGVYGGMAQLAFQSSKTTYEYGNSLENMGSQLTEEKNGSTIGFGVHGFVGVEYFFAPKVSIGGEYTWGLNFASTGDGETTTDVFGSDTVTNTVAGDSAFGIDTGTFGSAALKLQFYF